ncbi:hypothetical protein GGR57DRAFT_517664 [Xylariaceae sp. FL1272]|nr:hypothetical protein GGR57DRAFT_517664 [Xylariaceae sp. FL1272]
MSRVTECHIRDFESQTPRPEDFEVPGGGNRPSEVVLQHFDNDRQAARISVQLALVHPNLPRCRLVVYVDGSWKGRWGGYAVFYRVFGAAGGDQGWKRCFGGMQGTDNNGAELYAFSRALRIPLDEFAGVTPKPLVYVMTDSHNVQKQVRRFLANKPMILFEGISEEDSLALLRPLRALKAQGMCPTVTYSPSHRTIWGNEEANRYARRGRVCLAESNSSLVPPTGRYQVFSEGTMERAGKLTGRRSRAVNPTINPPSSVAQSSYHRGPTGSMAARPSDLRKATTSALGDPYSAESGLMSYNQPTIRQMPRPTHNNPTKSDNDPSRTLCLKPPPPG